MNRTGQVIVFVLVLVWALTGCSTNPDLHYPDSFIRYAEIFQLDRHAPVFSEEAMKRTRDDRTVGELQPPEMHVSNAQQARFLGRLYPNPFVPGSKPDPYGHSGAPVPSGLHEPYEVAGSVQSMETVIAHVPGSWTLAAD